MYYRGGNLLRVSRLGAHPAPADRPKPYVAEFNSRYLVRRKELGLPDLALPSNVLICPGDVDAWLQAFPVLKDAMDLFFGRNAKDEREIQQSILRDNNFGGVARSTDYYVCDIEYANSNGQFDIVGVHWPSRRDERKRCVGRRLFFAEVKQGDKALEGDSGLHQHILDINAYLENPGSLDSIKTEMITVFKQKRALGLLKCEKDLVAFSDEPPLLLLILVNHDPDATRLRELLRSLPPSPHAELRIATSSLMGYGLYDPGVMTVGDALVRFGDRI